jgi:malonyl-CoA O-methyltransferase
MNKPLKPTPSNVFLSWLSAELSERMNDKISLVKIIPSTVLEILPRAGRGLVLLRQNYPKAKLFATQAVGFGFLNTLKNLFGKGVPSFSAVSTLSNNQFDLKDAQVELVWASNWLFTHDSTWEEELKEWRRVLKVDGLLMFSYLGPDTGQELRRLPNMKTVWGVDMHDMGDVLVRSGFADPVMDMEYLTLTYDQKELFLKDVISLKLLDLETYPIEIDAQIDALRNQEGLWTLTLEVVYGHAWVVNRSQSGVATIRPEDITIRSK